MYVVAASRGDVRKISLRFAPIGPPQSLPSDRPGCSDPSGI